MRTILALATGASIGLVVGAVAGAALRDLHYLGRYHR